MTTRIGIVGAGDVARLHVDALRGAGAEVTAIAGLDMSTVAEFANAHGIVKRYLGASSLIRDPELDAVVVATPNPLHAEQAREAVAAGKHVLCEIPAGISYAEAEDVARDAESAGRFVMVAHTLRFAEPWLWLRSVIEDGTFTARHLIARRAMMRRSDAGWSGGSRAWVDSVLWHHGAHQIDLALWLLQGERPDLAKVDTVGALGEPWHENGQPMDVGAVLRVRSGGMATVSLSYHSELPVEDVLVIGDERTYLLKGGVLIDAGQVASTPTDPASDRVDADRMKFAALRRQDAEFVAAIAEGRQPRSSIQDVLPAMSVLEQLANS